MKMFKKIVIIMSLAILPVLAVGAPASVSAGPFTGSKEQACRGANLGAGGCDTDKASSNISTTLQRIINILTIIVGIAAVVVIIVNGLKFITSNGDSNSISSAKNGIIYAIVGLIIVAMAQVIVRFIINRIT